MNPIDTDKSTLESPSESNVHTCISVLETLLQDRALLSQLTAEDRKRLLMAAGKVSRPERLEIMKMSKLHRRNRKKKLRDLDRSRRAATGIRRARSVNVFIPPPREVNPENREREILTTPDHCYVCKQEFTEVHFFYDSMCPKCAEFNYQKRFQTASLEGRVALITGARVKIGFQAALMMLRAGAKVIVTTRFPRDAAARFSRESDFGDWSHRLEIHGLDLRHSPSVEIFCRYLNESYDRLDLLINNAAQTVRRPPGFYAELVAAEEAPFSEVDPNIQPLLHSHENCKGRLAGWRGPKGEVASASDGNWLTTWHEGAPGVGIRKSAALSQIPYASDRLTAGHEVFPKGKLDADLQQVDLRGMNSWRLKLADVPAPEMLEVQLVNAVAPFILCSQLKPLMLKTPNRDKHIVNVSAMEGKFARHTKTDKHPHTNMAKAALNMMTLTSAPDYAKDGIFMNAVDTGWVTDEDPHFFSTRKQKEHDFQPPLDIVDGAARICDPFFSGLLTGEHVWGKFLKDYFSTEW